MDNANSTARLGAGLGCFAVALGLSLGLFSVPGGAVAASNVTYRIEPEDVQGPDACGECHKSSIALWSKTRHSKTYKELTRRKAAKTITKKMGLKRIKSGSDCLTCHFTSAIVRGKTKAIAGITCESCHGGGKEWIRSHADFGGKGATAENESPDNRKARYAHAESNGMIRPLRLYDVAENCYSCHTVPNEKLVNVGGHPAGSKFELVSWSQGEVRHNVWYSKENQEASAERRRMMYIVGQALDLEYAFRGVAKATKKATYAVRMARRAAAAKKAMKKIGALVSTPEIKEIIAAAAKARLRLNNEDELTAAAERVAKAAKKFSESYDGSEFAAVDPLIPSAKKYKGKAAP